MQANSWNIEHIAGDENLGGDALFFLPMNSGTAADEASDDDILMLQGFKALAWLSFEQSEEN